MTMNWIQDSTTSTRRGSDCGCRRCTAEEAQLEELVQESLSAAHRHAQDWWEGVSAASGIEEAAEAAAGLAAEATIIDKDISISWTPRRSVADFLAKPNPGSNSKGDQWLYRFFLPNDKKPMYIGRVTDQILLNRIRKHAGAAAARPPVLPPCRPCRS